jgi:hypothetical protein
MDGMGNPGSVHAFETSGQGVWETKYLARNRDDAELPTQAAAG